MLSHRPNLLQQHVVPLFPLAPTDNLADARYQHIHCRHGLFIVIAADMGGQAWGNKVHENFVFSLVPYIPAIVGLLLLGRFLEGRERRQEVVLSSESLDPKAASRKPNPAARPL